MTCILMHMHGERTRVAVLGASGYAGGELVRLLAGHRHAEVTFLGAKDSVGHDARRGASTSRVAADRVEVAGADRRATRSPRPPTSCSAALPNGTSATLVPALLEAGLRVIDLAGDFRLPAEDYPQWYGFEHPAPALAREGGLRPAGAVRRRRSPARSSSRTPAATRPRRSSAWRRCSATGLIEPGAIRVDGKTGLSGAGRAANDVHALRLDRGERPAVPGAARTSTRRRSSGGSSSRPASRRRCCSCRTWCRRCAACSRRATRRSPRAPRPRRSPRRSRSPTPGAPFVRVLAPGAMADSKRVRGTNVIELQAVADAAHRHRGRRRRRRQPREGRGRPGDPEPEPRCSASTRRTGLPALAVYP